MKVQYWMGIEFHEKSGEYKSEPTADIMEALRFGTTPQAESYHKITLYAEIDGKTIGIPFSVIRDLFGKANIKNLVRDKLLKPGLN